MSNLTFDPPVSQAKLFRRLNVSRMTGWRMRHVYGTIPKPEILNGREIWRESVAKAIIESHLAGALPKETRGGKRVKKPAIEQHAAA